MRGKAKRLLSSILLASILATSYAPITKADVGGQGSMVGHGSNSGGSISNPGISFQILFMKQQELKVTDENFKQLKLSDGTLNFQSKSERMAFEMASGLPSSQNTKNFNLKPNFNNYASRDTKSYSIMMSLDNASSRLGNGSARFDALSATGQARYEYANQKAMGSGYVPSRMGITSSNTAAGSIWSMKNVLMDNLLKVTNNGTNWDPDAIIKEYRRIHDNHVVPYPDPNSSMKVKAEDSGIQQLRKSFLSIGAHRNQVKSVIDKVNSCFDSCKVGGKPADRSDITIATKEQAANIKNLYMLSICMIAQSPAYGFSGITAQQSYRTSTIKKEVEQWIEKGGNKDNSDIFMMFKIDSYLIKIMNGNGIFIRWDLAPGFYEGNVGATLAFSASPNPDKKGSMAYYKSGRNYKRNSTEDHKHRAKAQAKALGSAFSFTNWPVKGSFGDEYVMMAPTWPSKNTVSGNHSQWAGLVSYIHPATGNNDTMYMGTTYMCPTGPMPGGGTHTSVDPPNISQTAELKTDNAEVPEGSNGEVQVLYNPEYPVPPTDEVKKQYGLCLPKLSWDNKNVEVTKVYNLIDRINHGSISGNADKSNIPVEIEIVRTIEGGSGNTDSKMIDDEMKDQIQIAKCGQHNYRIEEDTGNRALIKFDINPKASCGEQFKHIHDSKYLTAQGKTGKDSEIEIQNCAISYLLEKAWSRIKFIDKDIPVTEAPGGKTTIHYDFRIKMEFPIFNEEKEVYGEGDKDPLVNASAIPGRTAGSALSKGWDIKPEGGAVYPASDWIAGSGKNEDGSVCRFTYSPVIRRSIILTRAPETPYYTNVGYDNKAKHYSEIKTNRPGNETFEAMAGTPTTRDLYMSTSGTEFRVDFNAKDEAKRQSGASRKYVYSITTGPCPGAPDHCEGACGTCLNPCPGHVDPETGKVTKHNVHIQHTVEHPIPHTWTYTVEMPIDEFSYFDMEDSETWRMTEWAIEGGEQDDFLTDPHPVFPMGTKIWTLNVQDYSSMSGRIVFDEQSKVSQQGNMSKFGDNTGSQNVGTPSNHEQAIKMATEKANQLKNAEKPFSGYVVSDYVVTKTSEGYQTPYFFSQKFSNQSIPSSAPDFPNAEGGDTKVPEPLKVPSVLDINDFWWSNGDKANCASKDNGWTIDSITYAGYNGKYTDLTGKYQNPYHKGFLAPTNKLEETLKKCKLSIDNPYPNQKKNGSGSCTFSQDLNNKEHIKLARDVIDTAINGEYDTGLSRVKYERVSFYQGNTDRGEKSSTVGKFAMTAPGLWENKSVPYYEGAAKVNDIVLHDPVSSEYCIVVSNPDELDKRSDKELHKGGDPEGAGGGVCPQSGCQFSTLQCTRKIEPHKDSCYEKGPKTMVHVGGPNSHTHTSECYDESGALNQCTRELNTHKCTSECKEKYELRLACNDPHHYAPGDPVDTTSPLNHYPLGDSRCWKRCGDDSKHGLKNEIVLPDGKVEKPGDTFINLDREFTIYYPFVGDFAEQPNLRGIPETTKVRGYGFVNKMNTKEWTEHRWVIFPVNVIDPKGRMRVKGEPIDLNEFSLDDEYFEFYCVLANNEYAAVPTSFTTVAINSPHMNKSNYYNESVGVTNKERVDRIYAARHTAYKEHIIDVVGYIGALSISDTGDFRFSTLFKQEKNNGLFLVPNLVPEVDLSKPKYTVSDDITVRLDKMSEDTHWLGTYGNTVVPSGGKTGGEQKKLKPLKMPLVPRYNLIPELRNQPMRPGYNLYMDVETDGNYYGVTRVGETNEFADNNMVYKMQIRPRYYSYDMNTKKYTPVDVYYGINNEYMMCNDFDYDFSSGDDNVGIKPHYLYLDWANEAKRRNYGDKEAKSTRDAVKFLVDNGYFTKVRIPGVDRDVIGSANMLYLNDLNRTFIGSNFTNGKDKNPGKVLRDGWYNAQSQRWHFTLGLPSSSVFVESGKECTKENILELQKADKYIVCEINILVKGEVWTLEYDGLSINSNGFQPFEGGQTIDPPDDNTNVYPKPIKPEPTPTPESGDPWTTIVIYPPDKTSKDDVIQSGTH